MKILIDMDGVISNFVEGVCTVFDAPYPEIFDHWEPGQYEMIYALSVILGQEITEEHLWEQVDKHGESFWSQLIPYPWMDDLIRIVQEAVGRHDWFICTSPSRNPVCLSGKIKWLQDRFGEEFRQFAITPHKYLLAKSDVILIDDSLSKIKSFRDHGGRGIVFGQYWNMRYWNDEFNPMDSLKVYLSKHIEEIQSK